jgi:hypothetical protein
MTHGHDFGRRARHVPDPELVDLTVELGGRVAPDGQGGQAGHQRLLHAGGRDLARLEDAVVLGGTREPSRKWRFVDGFFDPLLAPTEPTAANIERHRAPLHDNGWAKTDSGPASVSKSIAQQQLDFVNMDKPAALPARRNEQVIPAAEWPLRRERSARRRRKQPIAGYAQRLFKTDCR